VPPVAKFAPYRTAMLAAWALETAHRLARSKRRPAFTRQAVTLLGGPGLFSTRKIRERLGWTPKLGFTAAMAQIKRWWELQPT
jgi:nucleoside-diphosphate-sugar epimerase